MPNPPTRRGPRPGRWRRTRRSRASCRAGPRPGRSVHSPLRMSAVIWHKLRAAAPIMSMVSSATDCGSTSGVFVHSRSGARRLDLVDGIVPDAEPGDHAASRHRRVESVAVPRPIQSRRSGPPARAIASTSADSSSAVCTHSRSGQDLKAGSPRRYSGLVTRTTGRGMRAHIVTGSRPKSQGRPSSARKSQNRWPLHSISSGWPKPYRRRGEGELTRFRSWHGMVPALLKTCSSYLTLLSFSRSPLI